MACNTLPYKIAAMRDAHLDGFSDCLGSARLAIQVHDMSALGYPFNRSWRFASTGGSAKVAPSWVDGRDASAVWGEPPLGYGSL